MIPAPLILVVGPSGAGKDSLIEGALPDLLGHAVAARRVVTRPASVFEDHQSLSEDAFAAREAAGGFLLSWRAHGLAYGIPASVQTIREAGIAVIANVSRHVVDEARLRLSPVGVIVVVASREVLAHRLVLRGREGQEAIRGRLAAAEGLPEGDDVIRVHNERTLREGTVAFGTAVRTLCRRLNEEVMPSLP